MLAKRFSKAEGGLGKKILKKSRSTEKKPMDFWSFRYFASIKNLVYCGTRTRISASQALSPGPEKRVNHSNNKLYI